jgi:hypothetical protein
MPRKTPDKVKSKIPVVITRELKKEETMPTDSCQFFYECTNCKKILKPKYGGTVAFFVHMEVLNALRFRSQENIPSDKKNLKRGVK